MRLLVFRFPVRCGGAPTATSITPLYPGFLEGLSSRNAQKLAGVGVKSDKLCSLIGAPIQRASSPRFYRTARPGAAGSARRWSRHCCRCDERVAAHANPTDLTAKGPEALARYHVGPHCERGTAVRTWPGPACSGSLSWFAGGAGPGRRLPPRPPHTQHVE
jgi:hypothetical protein